MYETRRERGKHKFTDRKKAHDIGTYSHKYSQTLIEIHTDKVTHGNSQTLTK
jgi:hypothetical protein